MYTALADMMSGPFWPSLGLGLGVGLLYHVASYLTYRRAVRYEGSRFLKIFMGGLAVRMFVVVSVVALILVAAPVHRAAFVGSFLTALLVGIFAEVLRLHRLTRHGS